MTKRKREITARYQISQPDKYTLKNKPKLQRFKAPPKDFMKDMVSIKMEIDDRIKGKFLVNRKLVPKHEIVAHYTKEFMRHTLIQIAEEMFETWNKFYKEDK